MNESSDDRDATVLAHFRQDHPPLTHDPFVGATAQRVRTVRRRRQLLGQALQIGGVAALMLSSRWLIAGAAAVSARLDAWFGLGVAWLLTPLGTLIAATGVTAVVITGLVRQRRRG